jgi:hypothetical protein
MATGFEHQCNINIVQEVSRRTLMNDAWCALIDKEMYAHFEHSRADMSSQSNVNDTLNVTVLMILLTTAAASYVSTGPESLYVLLLVISLSHCSYQYYVVVYTEPLDNWTMLLLLRM